MSQDKSHLRRTLREKLAAISPADRHAKSVAACELLRQSCEFEHASVIMIFLSTPSEIDTSPIALQAWQTGKTVVAPKVSWDQRRMLPLEISSLTDNIVNGEKNLREPADGKPMPVDAIDLVIVPGLGFTERGHRIGQGMGFYDRFLALPEFAGLACGFAFESQMIPELPVLDHDMPLGMLVTDQGIRRFASNCMKQTDSGP